MIYFPSTHQIKQLQKGEHAFLRQFIIDNKIKTVDFSYKAINAEAVVDIAEALKGLDINCLNLGFNRMGAQGAIALAEHLKDTPIKELDLTRNGIGLGGLGVVDLIKILSATSVKAVKLAYNQIGGQSLRALDPILSASDMKVDLSHNKAWAG